MSLSIRDIVLINTSMELLGPDRSSCLRFCFWREKRLRISGTTTDTTLALLPKIVCRHSMKTQARPVFLRAIRNSFHTPLIRPANRYYQPFVRRDFAVNPLWSSCSGSSIYISPVEPLLERFDWAFSKRSCCSYKIWNTFYVASIHSTVSQGTLQTIRSSRQVS